MHDTNLRRTTGPMPGWQQRRSGVQFTFCCCPFFLFLAPFFIVARLLQYGFLRVLGRPAVSPWAQTRVMPTITPLETR